MYHKYIKSIRNYTADTDGKIAVLFAILALPLLILTSFALDISNATRVKTELSSALDDAALAAVLNQNLSVPERADFAKNFFFKNFKYSQDFELNVIDSSAERVELNSIGQISTSLIQAIGKEKMTIQETAVSKLTKADVICVLVLDPDGQQAFEVKRGSDFQAPTCSVQINSSHSNAAVVDIYSRASAKSFCAAGGANGAFKPFANTECSVIADPYKDLKAPASGPCVNDSRLRLQSTGANATEDGATLYPGTYCGGLTVSGLDVTFTPGEYIMLDGPLVFMSSASATANDVTFILRGNRAILNIQQGSELTLKAPSSGPLAGLAFFQDMHDITSGGSLKRPNGRNVLRGGAKMAITGTAYFPTQEIIVSGDSGLNTQAPATSFIGYRVSFDDNAQVIVNSDHDRAGIPPLLPRSDEGARLVQ